MCCLCQCKGIAKWPSPLALNIYTMHRGGKFRSKYSVLQLVQTQNGKIGKCTSINWKVQKEKKKPMCYNFWNVSNGMVCNNLFCNHNFWVICVNGKRALFPTKSRLRVAPNLGGRQTSGRNTLAVRDSEDTRKTLGGHATGSAENSHSHSLHQIS